MRELTALTRDDFLRGASTDDYIADGGFSALSRFNPFVEKGVVAGSALFNQITSNTFNGNPIAWARSISGAAHYVAVVTDTGRFYTLDATTFALRQTDTSKTYSRRITDCIYYTATEFYATSETDVAKITNADLSGTITPNWWSALVGSGLLAGVPHPIERVEDTIYIGDGNRIHAYNGAVAGGGASKNAVTLPPQVVVTELVKHPDGRHLIAFASEGWEKWLYEYEYGIAYIIDTTTWEFIREVRLPFVVDAARQVGKFIFTISSDRLGYFTGEGIEEVRKLKVGTKTISYPVSKHQMCDWKGNLFIVENENIVSAFANLGKGYGYFPILDYTANGIAPLSDDQLVLLTQANNFAFSWRIEERGPTMSLYSNWITLPQRATIQAIEVQYSPATTGTGSLQVIIDGADGTSGSATLTLSGRVRSQRARLYLTSERVRVSVLALSGDPLIHRVGIFGEYAV